jgi:hypothetical protein
MTSDRSRWLILALVVLAQLMVVLDATIVNIALPTAQQALGFWWSAAIFAAGAVVCSLLLTGRPSPALAEPVPVAAP